MRFIWTKRAVNRYLNRGEIEPKHTISGLPPDAFLDGWIKAARGAPWLFVHESGEIVRQSEER